MSLNIIAKKSPQIHFFNCDSNFKEHCVNTAFVSVPVPIASNSCHPMYVMYSSFTHNKYTEF